MSLCCRTRGWLKRRKRKQGGGEGGTQPNQTQTLTPAHKFTKGAKGKNSGGDSNTKCSQGKAADVLHDDHEPLFQTARTLSQVPIIIRTVSIHDLVRRGGEDQQLLGFKKKKHAIFSRLLVTQSGAGGRNRAKTGRGAEETSRCLNYHKSKKNSAMYKNPQ